MANACGMHESTIRDIFEDSFNPTRKTIKKLESVIPPDYLPSNSPEDKQSA